MLQSSTGVVQCLLRSNELTRRVRDVAGNPDNLFIFRIRQALVRFHRLKKPWFFGKQAYADNAMAELDYMEHQAYNYLKVNKSQARNPGTEKRVIHELLDDIQEAHTETVEYIHANNLRLYIPDRAGMTQQQSTNLDNNWDAIRNGTGTITIDSLARSYGPGTSNVNLPDFAKNNRAMFARIMSRPNGRQLVGELLDNSDGNNIPIDIRAYHPDLVNMGVVGAEANPYDNNALARIRGASKKFRRRGTGSGSLVGMQDGLQDSINVNQDASGDDLPSPAFILVAHELIHALHNKQGNNRRNVKSQKYNAGAIHHGWTNQEEHTTIDMGQGITENDLREEHNLGRRHGH